MVSKEPGYIVEFTEKDGMIQKGLVIYKEQLPSFVKYNKVLVRLVNDDMTPKRENNKNVISLKHKTQIKIIGFTD